MSKLAKKIAKILIDEGVLKCIPDDARIDRTRAGYWQRAAGALSWLLWWDGCTMSIGSQYPATLVAKGATVSVEMGTVILDPINLES